jgi:PAS domain-containing protein
MSPVAPPAIGTPAWWARLADGLDEMLWVWDAKTGRVLHANPALLHYLGTSQPPANGREVLLDRVAPDDAQRVAMARRQLPGEDFTGEYRLQAAKAGANGPSPAPAATARPA